MTDTQTAAPEVETVSGVKSPLQVLLDQYVALRASKDVIPADDFSRKGRELRRKIRAAGGTVRDLADEAVAPAGTDPLAPTSEPRVKKENKSKKARRQNQSELKEDPEAPAATAEEVAALASIMTGRLGDAFHLTQHTKAEVEEKGMYGYGLDIRRDTTATLAITKFMSRYGYEPEWFALLPPNDPDSVGNSTLMILGPVSVKENTPLGPLGGATPAAATNGQVAEGAGNEWGDEGTSEGGDPAEDEDDGEEEIETSADQGSEEE